MRTAPHASAVGLLRSVMKMVMDEKCVGNWTLRDAPK